MAKPTTRILSLIGETGHPNTCRRSVVGHGSQCEVTNTHRWAVISKPILWSITATDEGLSVSRHVLVTDNPSFCQVCTASPARASSTLNHFSGRLYEIVYQKRTNGGWDVARKNNYPCWSVLTQTVSESMLGDGEKMDIDKSKRQKVETAGGVSSDSRCHTNRQTDDAQNKRITVASSNASRRILVSRWAVVWIL